MTFYKLSSSLRERPPEVTLEVAKTIGKTLGISRLIDVTHLDKIGIPVFASVRPSAAPGNLCVNAGKGLTKIEAAVGALMEGIEYAMAEPGASIVDFKVINISTLEKSFPGQFSIMDLCPIWKQNIDFRQKISAVKGKILGTENKVWLPAELIFMPTCNLPYAGTFLGNTSGLSSGNTFMEACVHALTELLERDTTSINFVQDRSSFVLLSGLPNNIESIINAIQSANLELIVRYTESLGGLPYFEAYIIEPNDSIPIAISAGYGLHPSSEIALVRAVIEAAQARLSHIHGGRDDIIRRHELFLKRKENQEAALNRSFKEYIKRTPKTIRFESIKDFSDQCSSIESTWDLLIQCLQHKDIGLPIVVPLAMENYPLQVIRMVVPGLEQFDPEIPRVGKRMLSYFANASVS